MKSAASKEPSRPDGRLVISYRQGYVMRGIAMLALVFVHSLNEYPAYTSSFAKAWMVPSWGEFASSLFFFMSGYGLLSSMTSHEDVDSRYLARHIRKLLVPFLTTYLLVVVALMITQGCGDAGEWHLKNILTLGMPDGTDMWFFKTIFLFYFMAFFCVKVSRNNGTRLLLLGALLSLYSLALYANRYPGYWYDSNLCFVVGACFAIGKVKMGNRLLLLSFVLFAAFYVLSLLEYRKAPLQVAGNIACCVCMVWALSRLHAERKMLNVVTFIGENSLMYYLLSVPVMLVIPGERMHWIVYFLANLFVTTLFVLLYRKTIGRLTIR